MKKRHCTGEALREALIEAGASVRAADQAAEEGAARHARLASLDTRLALLTWMMGANIGLTIFALGQVLTMGSMLGAISGHIAQIARATH